MTAGCVRMTEDDQLHYAALHYRKNCHELKQFQQAGTPSNTGQRLASSSHRIHQGRTWGGPDAATVEVLTIRKRLPEGSEGRSRLVVTCSVHSCRCSGNRRMMRDSVEA